MRRKGKKSPELRRINPFQFHKANRASMLLNFIDSLLYSSVFVWVKENERVVIEDMREENLHKDYDKVRDYEI